MPCPFCGGKAETKWIWRQGVANRKLYWIECRKCWVAQYHQSNGGYATPRKAAKAWNSRKVWITKKEEANDNGE